MKYVPLLVFLANFYAVYGASDLSSGAPARADIGRYYMTNVMEVGLKMWRTAQSCHVAMNHSTEQITQHLMHEALDLYHELASLRDQCYAHVDPVHKELQALLKCLDGQLAELSEQRLFSGGLLGDQPFFFAAAAILGRCHTLLYPAPLSQEYGVLPAP